jgi:hypothetical protein
MDQHILDGLHWRQSEVELVQKLSAWFAVSAGAIFLVTGSAKILGSFGHAPILNFTEPVSGLPFRLVMSAVGTLEIVLSPFCLLLLGSKRFALRLVAWVATCFCVYRISLWFIGWKTPCQCMGSLTDALHLSPASADLLARVLLGYLLFGSYSILCYSRIRKCVAA